MTTTTEVQSFLSSNSIDYLGTYPIVVTPYLYLYPLDDTRSVSFPVVSRDYFQRISLNNESKGIRTIWIKPWEFLPGSNTRRVLESVILSCVGKTHHLFNARDCEVREVSTSELRPFLLKNSNYGWRASSLALGLFLKKTVDAFPVDTLLMIYTFGHPFFGHKKYDLEIIRSTTEINCLVRGGASKLFKYFLDNYPAVRVAGRAVSWETLVYYVDFDHYSGRSLKHLGFQLSHLSAPGFMNVWADTETAFHRRPLEHGRIVDLVKQGKVYPVYNSGSKVFTYTKP